MRTFSTLIFLFIVINTTYGQFDDKFYFPKKEWNNIDSVKYEAITFKTDTALLSGIILEPKGKQPIATIIYFHGAGGNVTTYVPIVKPIADAGFRVFMIDMQGYGRSSGKPSHMNIAADAQVVVNAILQRRDVAHTKVIIMGASMGTQVATRMAKDNHDKIAALVLEGTISSFTDIAADSSPKDQQEMIRNFLKSPYSAKEDIKQTGDIRKLLVHSSEDSTVPFAEGRSVYENAPQPKELWVIKGEHLGAIDGYRAEFIDKLKALVK